MRKSELKKENKKMTRELISTITKKALDSVLEIKSYMDLVNYFNMNIVLCNDLIDYFDDIEVYSGDTIEYYNDDGDLITREEWEENGADETLRVPTEFYHYFIIDEETARDLKYWTDETVFYIPSLDLHIWAVAIYGTSWNFAPITLNEEAVKKYKEEHGIQ